MTLAESLVEIVKEKYEFKHKAQILDVFFQLTPLVMSILQHGKVIKANQAWNSILNWQVSNVLGKDIGYFVHSEDFDKLKSAVEKLNKKQSIECSVRLLTGQRDWKWIFLLGSPLNGVSCIVGVPIGEPIIDSDPSVRSLFNEVAA